jgi:disulfide bond formation protein DsbB
MTRSGAGVADAVRDGAARVGSAPAVLAGTVAVLMLLWLPPNLDLRDAGGLAGVFPWWVALGRSDPFALSGRVPLSEPALAAMDIGPMLGWLLLWSFVSGGILDRYARNRATRSRGFFGACGGCFPSMLRLGVITLLIDAALWAWLQRMALDGWLLAAIVACLAVHLVVSFARVRLVVEDRRSAVGALLAGARFVRREPAAALLYLLFAAVSASVTWLYAAVEPGYDTPNWRVSLLAGSALIIGNTAVLFATYASAIALFQSRLAHAGYAAAPPIVWPESPAAEAIGNGASTLTP